MYSVNGTEITLSRGDTGALRIRATAKRRDTGADYVFGERDRAVFSIKAGNGQVVKQKSYPIISNMFTVVFFNDQARLRKPGGRPFPDVSGFFCFENVLFKSFRKNVKNRQT